MLAYVAVTGPMPRERIAALLWPDAPEESARANLRQLLKRLREKAPELLSNTPERIELSSELEVDVHQVLAGAPPGDDLSRGELLAGYAYDDVGELAEWLQGARAQLVAKQVALWTSASDQAERAGRLDDALAAAQSAIDANRLSEEAWRRLMRLHHSRGDRGAAMGAYERCRLALEQELGVAPSAETRELATRISAAEAPRAATGRAAAARPLPPSVPFLVGREREWALMEDAWAQGKNIIISGAAGMGKSRLLHEFVRAKAASLVYCGRPSDRAIPYGTHARTFRQMVQVVGEEKLPAWVKNELARIIPGLGRSPGPLRTPEDRLRFFMAKVEVNRPAIAMGYDSLAFDDVQYVDDASMDAGFFVMQHVQGEMRTVHAYRSEEVPEKLVAIVEQGVKAGVFCHLELQPLSLEDTERLLAATGVPGAGRYAEELFGLAAGNPMLTLEALKARLQPGEAAAPGPGEAEARGPGQPILRARLSKLSAPALQLARAIAVLGTYFSLERTRRMLEARAVEVATWWSELEAAQIVRGNALAHDLICEELLRSLPRALSDLLHRRAAEVLSEQGAPPGIVAQHWLEAGDHDAAAVFVAEAARAARDAMVAPAP